MCENCETEAKYQKTTIHNGFKICTECGLQLNRVLDTNSEWYVDTGERFGSIKNRVGQQADPLLQQMSMRTYIRQRHTQHGAKARIAAQGIIRQHTWIANIPYCERVRQEVFRHIREACQVLDIDTATRRKAEFIYTKAIAEAKSRSAGKMGIIAASVLIASKQAGHPRSPVELSAVFPVSPAIITKGVSTVYLMLNGSDLMTRKKVHVTNAIDFIPRFCSKLGLDQITTAVATRVAENAIKHKISRQNTPPSVAGGTILFVITIRNAPTRVQKNTKKAIADVAGVSVVTISKVRKQFSKYRSYILTQEDKELLINKD